MAKEKFSRDIDSEIRLSSKTAPSLHDKQSLKTNKRLNSVQAVERDVVVSDAEPLPQADPLVAAETYPTPSLSAEPVSEAQIVDGGVEQLGQTLPSDSLASLLSQDSVLSKGSQLLAQASTGAMSTGASGSAAATTATTATSAAGATATGATAGAAAAAGAVGAGVAVAATVAVAAVAASSKEDAKDTTPPVAPSLALTSDTNITTDGITSNGSVTVSGLESGATWQYSTDGGTNWTTGSGTSFTLASGTYAASALKVRQTDAAGNVSSVGTNASGITVDSAAPAAPTAVTLQTSDATTVTFSVALPAGIQAGDTAQLYVGSSTLGSAVSVTSGDITAGSVSVTVAKTLLGSSGVKSIQAELTDVAGNHSTKSTALSITYQPDNAVSDGYIQGASVYLDINRDGVITTNIDKLVGTTDATGNFSALLTSDQLTYDLLAQGGVDVSTGLAYLGMLKAPAGSTILNPLTTLVQTMAADSLSANANATDAQRAQALADAQTTLKQALNLPDTDLTKLDLLKVSVGAANSSTVTASDAVDLQAKAVMVANLIKTGASALEGASGGTTTAADASKFVIQGLVQNLKTAAETGQTVQLSDSTSIGTVLTAALNNAAKDVNVKLDTSKATDAMNATSVALANVNEFITAAAGSAAGGGSVAQALTQVVQAQVIAQSDVANALKSTSGNLTAVTALGNVADVRAAATGVNTSNLVLAQNVTAQTVAADTTAPTVLRVGAKADALTVYHEGDLLVFGVGFSEGVLVTRPADGWLDASGVPNAGTPTYTFTIGDQTRTAYYDPGQSSGNVLRLIYKIKGNDTGSIAFTGTSLGGSPVITDLAGNALASTDFPSNTLQLPTTWAVQALTFAQTPSDTTAPTVVITNNAPANNAPATGDVTYTFTFSEKVVGFTPADIDVTNGLKGKFTANAEGTVYTLVVKPNTGFAGQMNLQLKAGQLFDQAGNALAANVNSNVLVDMQPPTVRIETSALELSPTQNSVQVKFILSDSPAGGTALTTDDLVVTGGALSNFSGAGTTYTATLTMQTGATAVNIGVKPGAFTDAQGMLSMGAGFNFAVQQSVNFRTLTQNFVSVGSGQTFAFSNEGTAQNTADDKQGVYTLQATDSVTVAAFVKQGLTSLPSDAQALLDAIASAANATAFNTAIANAKAKMDLQFGVKLGDTVDITGDGVAEKGAIATLLYVPPTGANVVFAADSAAAFSAALQPVALTQAFVKVAAGKTLAYSNNGTLANASDDKQGAYTLTGTEVVTVMVAPKPGAALPGNAQTLLNAIKNATTVSAFATAVSNAKAVMEVNFGVNLGDSVDITGDKVADKGSGAALMYVAPAGGATEVTLTGDAGVVATAGIQPIVLSQTFLSVGTGKTFAYANNGTPTNTGDDRQGAYTLQGSEKITLMVAPKPNEALPADAASLLSAIKNATTVSAFVAAVAAAKAKMEVNFSVNLGDGVDITGDTVADKGASASLVYTPPSGTVTTLTLTADAAAVTGGGIQPVLLTQDFLTVGTGKTFAFSNNGTPTNSGDDKQGAYQLAGTEKVSVVVAAKPGQAMPESAQTLLNAIKNATSVSAFATAVAAAKAVMEVNFGVNLGDGVDITGDGASDKGSAALLAYSVPAQGATSVNFVADSSALGGGLQPVVLTQAFVKAGTGQTFAFSNNGTPTNTSDDKQGAFTLTGNEKVTVMVAPKPGEAMPSNAQTLLNAIKNATSVSAFATAVAAAKAVMEVSFGVNLGDGADITGDGLADKGAGAALVYSVPAANATLITLAADSGSVTAVGLQPVMLSQDFIKTAAGHTFASSNNGTLNVSTDDKYGAYYLTGSERVAVMASVRTDVGEVTNAQALLNALAGATTAQEFNAAVNNAIAKLSLSFGVNLGDSVDITKDGALDKGSSAGLTLRPIASTDSQVVFAPQASQKLDLSASAFLNFQVSANASTLAFSSNGTPFVSSDDVLGIYTLLSTDKLGIAARIKADASANNINFAQLLANIKSAASLDAFNAALTSASPYLEVVFGVNVGDRASINGDSVLEKDTLAKLTYATNGNLSPSMEFPLMDLNGKSFLRAGMGSGAAISLGNFSFSSDDKYGSYLTTVQDASNLKLNVKILDAIDATEFQIIKGLVNAIKTADNLSAFSTAMNAANANSHIQVSLLNYLGDFKDINADGSADWNAYSIYTMQGGAVNSGVYVLKPYVQSTTVLPSWITDPAYNPVQSAVGQISAVPSTQQLAMASLISNDGEAASWLAKVSGVRPAGASLNGSALNLSYAFQTTGAVYQDAQGVDHTISAGFTSAETSFIRSVFGYFGEVANIKFTETESQAKVGDAGAADIRMFKDTAAKLVNGDKTTLGFAYQPVSANPKAVDQDGNFFLVSDANELPTDGSAFQRLYGDEKNTVVHELGHALGLDHPFAEGNNAGFNWFGSTATGTTLLNHLNQRTGGGHDLAATDYMLETIMTYQNPYKNVGVTAYGSSNTNTPWKLGVYDIAALQHLYGANMSFNADNNVYSYNSNQLVFDTIWDAGGNADMIRQVGDRSAIIDLRGGDYMSRVGLYGGAEYDFSKVKIQAANENKTLTGLEVQYDDGPQGMKNTGYLSELDTATQSWHWIADPTMPVDKEVLVIMSFSDNSKATLKLGSQAVPDPSMAYNLGIAFGVVIEQAAGGGGNDVLIGNSAANVLIGNGGNDVLKGGGADTAEDLFVFFKAFNNGSDVIQDFENGYDRIAIETGGDGVVGTPIDFADQATANRYYAATQSGSDVMVTLYAGDAGTGNTTIGSVNLKDFNLSSLNYLDFKVI